MVWKFANPVQIEFGVDRFERLPELIGNRRYALVTYGEPFFDELAQRLAQAAGAPVLTIRDVAPNPDPGNAGFSRRNFLLPAIEAMRAHIDLRAFSLSWAR